MIEDKLTHIERLCQRCGRTDNPSWFVESDLWNAAASTFDVICPTCFIALHEAVTGSDWSWQLIPDPLTQTLDRFR